MHKRERQINPISRFELPRLNRKIAIGLLATALVAAFTLASCVSAERLQLNTILQCEIPARVYEGANLLDEAHPYYPLLAVGDPVLVNPFVATQNGEEYLVAYDYNPPLQFHIRKSKVTYSSDCRTTKGTLQSQYNAGSGYRFQTESGENLQAGYIRINPRKK